MHKPFVVSLLTQYIPNIPDSYTWELQSLEMHSNITGTCTHIHMHPRTDAYTHTITHECFFLKHKTSLITHTDYDSWFSMALANHSGEVCEIFSMMLLTWKHRLWIWRSHMGSVSRAAKDKTNFSSRTVKVGQWTATSWERKSTVLKEILCVFAHAHPHAYMHTHARTPTQTITFKQTSCGSYDYYCVKNWRGSLQHCLPSKCTIESIWST